ncbi:signal recognition particle, SRP9/SRP14 subunit [Phakopsora pachyrhizi]|uniref:Signal recognition particle, SRP9/SRP14 subunit n=1 Tax=Phakopsora pachyrhizi TaxID=170000 RepID=A0AAV0BLC4_PHAPC|nr:signal recognition particle, SRP9/SRP14 subunit [Phakopsora pachyrhizi]
MVYLRSWDSFVMESIKLYQSDPQKTRYCFRWRQDLGLLVLKVTDDRKCLKFKTRSAAYLNRFDQFNRTMIQKIQNRNQDKKEDQADRMITPIEAKGVKKGPQSDNQKASTKNQKKRSKKSKK